MFSRVIPPWETLDAFPQQLNIGERALVNFLDNTLPKDISFDSGNDLESYEGWLIFVQPYLNGTRPDIILFNPRVGVQIIEVKDWDLKNYEWKNGQNKNDELYVKTSTGSYPVKSPVRQVEYYKDILSGQLLPQIGEQIDKNVKAYALIRTAIYFHNASTEQCHKLFGKKVKKLVDFPIFGNDQLKPEFIQKIIPDSGRQMSYFWDSHWNKEVLFWLNPPFHSLEQTQSLKLNSNQLKFADPAKGHHRVRGVAGSGKTQVLAYRAGKLASLGKKVLILSFNITLWHYIRDMIQRSPFEFSWDRITFNHFHGFCKDVLNRFGIAWPTIASDNEDGREELFRRIVPDLVTNTITGRGIEKYDAILIDEGQDYYAEWYLMLCDFLNERNELVVVCDKKQKIYKRDLKWIDRRKNGLKEFGDWIELKKIIRLPEGIAKMVIAFGKEFNLNNDVEVENIERPDMFNQFVEHVAWYNTAEEKWLRGISWAFDKIKQDTSASPSDIIILLPDFLHGLECVSFFKTEKGIDANHIFEENEEENHKRKKRAFWLGDSRLKMSTVHSFKGWEALSVIIYIPKETVGDVNEFDSLIYTGLTRTRQNLIVINSNPRYKKFGERISKNW